MAKTAGQKQTKIHLNWDSLQDNGIIMNATYPWGAYFESRRPSLSFDFDDFQYSEHFVTVVNYVKFNGIKRKMTTEEEAEVVALATSWVQDVGQEGNPSQEQMNRGKIANSKGILMATSFILDDDMFTHLNNEQKNSLKAYRQELYEVLQNPLLPNPIPDEYAIEALLKFGLEEIAGKFC